MVRRALQADSLFTLSLRVEIFMIGLERSIRK